MTALKCRFIFYVTLVIAVLSPHTGFAAEEIRVGATVSLEGRFKDPSRMLQLSYRLWEQQVNDAGGLLGRPVRLIFYDDKSKKELVRSYYEKMIEEENVDMVLSPYGTTLTYAASEVTERHGYVLMASAASGSTIWNRGYRHVFGVYGMAKRYFIGFLDLAARNGLKSVAIINEDTLFTKDAAVGAIKWAQRLGLEIKLKQTYKKGSAELPGVIVKLERLQPDAVILCSYPPDGYVFLEKLYESPFTPKALAMSITPGLPEFGEKAGEKAEGVFGPSQWEPDERIPFPGTRKFIHEFTRFAGVSPSYHAGAAYAACQLLQKGITAHGAIDHDRIRDYIAALDTVTVIGRFKVDHHGGQVGHNTLIIQWQNGKKYIVYPSKMQTRRPQIGTLRTSGQ